MSDVNGMSSSPLLWACYANGVVTVHGEVDIATYDRFRTILKAVVDLAWGRVPGLRLEQTRRPLRRQGPAPERAEPTSEPWLGATG